jgi:hypothetical protein
MKTRAEYQAAYRERRLARKGQALKKLWDLRASAASPTYKKQIDEIIELVERLH